MIGIWDDHEFANDTYYPAVAPDDNPESDPTRRLVANQVWFEYIPAPVPYNPNRTFEDSVKIYRTVTFGNLASILHWGCQLYLLYHIMCDRVIKESRLSSTSSSLTIGNNKEASRELIKLAGSFFLLLLKPQMQKKC
ncbi:hypothetical protein E2R53_22455 [Peribacillus frigoritolerans]|nr:hypothetical protein E2R53_22455 [Peribacillus frigoritolerans]